MEYQPAPVAAKASPGKMGPSSGSDYDEDFEIGESIANLEKSAKNKAAARNDQLLDNLDEFFGQPKASG